MNHGVSKKVRWEHKKDREIQDRSEPWCIESETIRKIDRSRIEVNHGVSKKVRWEHKKDR